MNLISPIEIFIALFIGMGPIKVLLIYIATTEGMEKSVRRGVARRTVLVAGIVGLGLFLLGAILQAILHFSIGSLTIFGGLILLLWPWEWSPAAVAQRIVSTVIPTR
jgi:small neutral amino acid transporter SnatA (MarC family)